MNGGALVSLVAVVHYFYMLGIVYGDQHTRFQDGGAEQFICSQKTLWHQRALIVFLLWHSGWSFSMTHQHTRFQDGGAEQFI